VTPINKPPANPGLFLVPPGATPSDLEPGPPADVPQQLHESVCKAIKQQRMIRFLYSGKIRIVEPYDYGVLTGRSRLFSYQTAGESGTGRLPDWRLFDVAKLTSFELLDVTFAGDRPVPTEKQHQWEKLFIRVSRPK
jgi:hypothetical protein